jgi:hypothetical protein
MVIASRHDTPDWLSHKLPIKIEGRDTKTNAGFNEAAVQTTYRTRSSLLSQFEKN